MRWVGYENTEGDREQSRSGVMEGLLEEMTAKN